MNQTALHTLFEGHPDFLAHTLAASSASNILQLPDSISVTFDYGEASILATGIFIFVPTATNRDKEKSKSLLLSAGVHGNETAPIEELNALVTDILNGKLKPTVPVMVLLAHPEAIKQQQRFIEFNMNRLFCGSHQEAAYADSVDAKRAALLEQAVQDFHQRFGIASHLDLHTAIRDSEIERFGLYPFVPGRSVPQHWIAWLAEAGIHTLLLQNTPSTTFSAHTAKTFGCESFTLELGKVRPFGQNDLSRLTNLRRQIEQLLHAKLPTKADANNAKKVQLFEVAHEIIHRGENFVLNIPEDIKNFSAYPKGFEVWRDGEQRYCVQAEQEFIVFPNSKVPKGQRAGLMLRVKSQSNVN